ncbi:MAG: 4-(cytidine 5'-diphospho)-2-C-methyl-D-erythritol kinase [Hoeflea sp.]|uniref:4-(cytidine 5'-diphospho)-2-C-methyl-D-erythritol kinase n=1 Tax=Hoeflea sp. TaxID=1940281 RepID=UPI001D9B18C9|nr:4-(cytidine 5'-diphospho)-2-C-methyl-D-erythritol kinase [Hoeflea sp.]MBU4527686.1 4-(cytidine 5'-diphospho)-2-C-methyl-D-erythritol kinase [Alphaproteobacteria bacterium]MBU4546446.1 4-(cytidine 5'-diphospho)-2-C-methyl-D-erythritol kinase [Alphaproteobacteria bacterium]MBU4553036.1 4-(cytidine 5'-diphospho)-2-C-methyl-D-erythritol kinase [Alphaproteobacteria bacterium]MBV1724108.1 4-(cytidine 5'-diphospho)-2-C-methyl-D-erythritol kinase [Hoeflea sp.]MBV1759793.1 4-(cytidine 5'-diphospho)-
MQTRDAPAKINLALHVTGRRADGYHLIESFVVFTELGDRVSARLADHDGFSLEGPEARALSAEDARSNLVVRARDALREAAPQSGRVREPVHITLDKQLPVASGIGGGSADAAATLRLLCDLWDFRPAPEDLSRIALGLGADVPMCLNGQPLIARGIGEALEPAGLGFALDLVIVNPRIGVSTPAVFSALEARENAPLPALPGLGDRDQFITWLAGTRNDLEPPALQLVPEIGACLSALTDAGALFVRMSGSGASCFGLFENPEAARDAANRLGKEHPSWYVSATRTVASA